MYLKILLKLCCFGFSCGFFPEQKKLSTVKKPTRLKPLRAKFSTKRFFSSSSVPLKETDQ